MEKGSVLVIDDDASIISDCPSLEVIDFSNAAEISEPEFYDDCPKLKKVLLPQGDANELEKDKPSGGAIEKSLENALKLFKPDMEKAGFTYKLIINHDVLSQVEIFTNKDELSEDDRARLKGICDAVASAPDTGLEPDLKDAIADCDYTEFRSFGGTYYVGSDKMALGYREDGGCLVFFINND